MPATTRPISTIIATRNPGTELNFMYGLRQADELPLIWPT